VERRRLWARRLPLERRQRRLLRDALREAADYDAVMVPRDEAERIVDLAGRFVAAVDAAIVT
jgi:hypothetical protein